MFQSIGADNVAGGEGAAPAPFCNGSHFGGLSGGARVCPRVPAKVNRRKSYVQAGGSIPRVSQQQDKERTLPPKATDFDVAYFHSYAHLGIHEEMIKDRVRTETYRNAIFHHQDRIAGKVVVDVGCGTGILSIFCAQAGARRVYAVDASDIAVQANEVVKANNLSETVFVLHGRVEDVEINEKVDVIVSEWMGYMLLYESMLGSVITARDRWLKPGGLILPSHATLYIAPVCHSDRYNDSVGFWRNVYGIDMSAMMPLAKQCAFEEPSVESISGENVLAWPNVVKHVDCSTVTIQELESITATFRFTSMMRVPFHGFAFWFDVEFGVPAKHSSSDKASPASIEASDDKIDVTGPAKRSSSDKVSPASIEAPDDKIDLGVPAIHSSSDKASPSSVEAPLDKIDLGVPAIHSSSDKASPSSIEAPHDEVTGSSSSMKRAHPDDVVTGSSPSTKRAKPNKPLILSTAPENSPTHWQQTLIYLFEPLDMEQDQIIEGSVTLAQSKENARFMNIRLEYKACGRSFVKESVMR